MASGNKGGPTIVGINRTQDGSICVMRGSRVVCCIQKERLTRQKHHWGKLGDLRKVYRNAVPGLEQPVDALVECFSSDDEIANLERYEQEIAETLTLAPDCRRARISHHLSHVYSVFPPSPFEEAAVMIVDGQGSPVASFTEAWPQAEGLPAHWREVSSFYRVDRSGRMECLGKQLWEGESAQPMGLGMFYFLLTQAMFPGAARRGDGSSGGTVRRARSGAQPPAVQAAVRNLAGVQLHRRRLLPLPAAALEQPATAGGEADLETSGWRHRRGNLRRRRLLRPQLAQTDLRALGCLLFCGQPVLVMHSPGR